MLFVSQFFSGEKYAFILSKDNETKVWQLCMRSITSNAQYII